MIIQKTNGEKLAMTEICTKCKKEYKAIWHYSTDSEMTNEYGETICCTK